MSQVFRELLRDLPHGNLRTLLEQMATLLESRSSEDELLALLGRHVFPEVGTTDATLAVGSVVALRGDLAVAARPQANKLPDGTVVSRSGGKVRLALGGVVPVRVIGWEAATVGQTVFLSTVPGMGQMAAPGLSGAVRCRLGEIVRRDVNPIVWVAMWGPFRAGGQGS